ncbi:dynein axonemal assembly factor 11 [Antennarius striatus]|uniref:dynein axonemal assembly factor 11 n=1 Tax=Antennarius striatus TaxID=241820 RepID=UPI0035B30195
MVYITEELVRQRAEHNECEIFSLEEISLHQQHIERIQHLDRWCRQLRILYLQNNLIPRIENLGRLKKLEYLNLAVNNIEVIENLEGCESLQRLDLTLNFVGRLSSTASLRQNPHLSELFLVGNPCTGFEGYRQYVVASLPQLKRLDGTEISRSERILASQDLESVRRRVMEQEREYLERRARQKEEEAVSSCLEDEENQEEEEEENQEDEEKEREFWNTPCSFTPESRLKAYRFLEKKKAKERMKAQQKLEKRRTLITSEGRVLNVNAPKLDFTLTEDEENNTLVLDLGVYRHLDTSLIDVDVHPTYARVSVKGKVFQIVLPAEVKPDSSTTQRSQTTGHLVLTMPRAEGEVKVRKTKTVPRPIRERPTGRGGSPEDRKSPGPEWLEVDPGKRSAVDLTDIVRRDGARKDHPRASVVTPPTSTAHSGFSEGFVDDPEVPPLLDVCPTSGIH